MTRVIIFVSLFNIYFEFFSHQKRTFQKKIFQLNTIPKYPTHFYICLSRCEFWMMQLKVFQLNNFNGSFFLFLVKCICLLFGDGCPFSWCICTAQSIQTKWKPVRCLEDDCLPRFYITLITLYYLHDESKYFFKRIKMWSRVAIQWPATQPNFCLYI